MFPSLECPVIPKMQLSLRTDTGPAVETLQQDLYIKY